MKYIPQSNEDRRELLNAVGAKHIDELFQHIPSELRVQSNLNYPLAQSEQDLRKTFQEIGALSPSPKRSFAGCGIYQHEIPSVVPFLQGRSEFSTAYTPFQPEISQGLLQCIYEFQTLACQLTEMELSNASLYDGATSLGEAILMALRIKKRSKGKILISQAIQPFYLQVVQTYCKNFQDRIQFIPLSGDHLDISQLKQVLNDQVDILVTQSPNVFGVIENYPEIASLIKESKVLWLTSTMEPLSFGLTKGPGAYGAHIVTAEGQSFGNSAYLGGSTYGIFCTKDEFIRNLPGRLVGQTLDQRGRRSYTLTFATREQFIRRGRATSNICTNNNLNMLAGLIHMSVLGKRGIRELAEQNFSKTEFLKDELRKSDFQVSDSPTFNEFVLETKQPASHFLNASSKESWVCGVDLGRFKEEWKHKLLIHVSELHSKEELLQLTQFLRAQSK